MSNTHRIFASRINVAVSRVISFTFSAYWLVKDYLAVRKMMCLDDIQLKDLGLLRSDIEHVWSTPSIERPTRRLALMRLRRLGDPKRRIEAK
ncbi:MAG: hypothetical protein AAGE89_12730 [Pseudomonadota bacterium]